MNASGPRCTAVVCLTLLALAPLAGTSTGAQTRAPERPVAGSGPRVVVRADPRVVRSFVAPPRSELRGAERAATITVIYTGFTPQAQAAFQHAVNIWAGLVTSSVPIIVEAEFTTLGGNVLGSAGPWLVRGASGLAPNTWYPTALANKITGTDLLPGTSDIDASFNSSFGWYYGTDGNAPPGTYDFVSVVLHELGHGLGFVGSMQNSGGSGSWGLSGFPIIYDHFTENGAGQGLMATFPNPSTALGSQLTSNDLHFDGARVRLATGGGPARIYAPSTWQPGSSYSHLNEGTYPAGNPNSLMTPQIASSEAIHGPGPITLGIFEDLGWTVNLLTTPRNFRLVR